jgi:hypothetical protein
VDDALFQFHVGKRNVQMQAATLPARRKFARLLLVRKTNGGSAFAFTVPISGIDTW